MVALNLSTILAANNTTFLSSSNYTATAGQVKFAADYTVGYVEVYQNGLRLADSDFTAANGEHVLLNSAASVSDNIDIIAHQAANLTVLGAALPTTNMIAGTGLTGGGTLAANRTFNLATNIATANLTASGLVAGITGRFGLYADGINMEQGTGGSYSVGNASYIQRDSGGDLHITSGSSTARNLFFRTKTTGGTSATLNTSGDLNVEGTGVFKQGMPIRVAGGNNVVLALTDNGKLLMCTNTASAMSVRIPNNSAVAFPIGAEISLVNVLTHATANTLGIAQTAGVILQSKEAANTIADRFTSATLKKTATNTWLLIGNLA